MTLKPCPYCKRNDLATFADRNAHFVRCFFCGARGPVAECHEDAEAFWNVRDANVSG